MVIWKFTIERGVHILDMPKGAILTSALAQGEDAVIYALCDPQADSEKRRIRVMVTGFEGVAGIENWKFLATIQFRHGLVFHVFYE